MDNHTKHSMWGLNTLNTQQRKQKGYLFPGACSHARTFEDSEMVFRSKECLGDLHQSIGWLDGKLLISCLTEQAERRMMCLAVSVKGTKIEAKRLNS